MFAAITYKQQRPEIFIIDQQALTMYCLHWACCYDGYNAVLLVAHMVTNDALYISFIHFGLGVITFAHITN